MMPITGIVGCPPRPIRPPELPCPVEEVRFGLDGSTVLTDLPPPPQAAESILGVM